jgi:hypothetical protein
MSAPHWTHNPEVRLTDALARGTPTIGLESLLEEIERLAIPDERDKLFRRITKLELARRAHITHLRRQYVGLGDRASEDALRTAEATYKKAASRYTIIAVEVDDAPTFDPRDN